MTCTGMLVLSGFRPRCLNIVSAAPYRVEQILANNVSVCYSNSCSKRAHLQVRHPLRLRVSNRDRGVGAEARYRGLTEVSEGERDMGGTTRGCMAELTQSHSYIPAWYCSRG